jgi:hypothetical protein
MMSSLRPVSASGFSDLPRAILAAAVERVMVAFL